MISVNNVTLSFGKRVLFDEVNINFVKGNCYGVIGANGAGKSTFIKILSGEIEPNKGTVDITPGERMAVLRQDQFQFDGVTALHTVMMGHKKMWDTMLKKDALYMKEDFTEEDGMKAGELEAEFGEMGGYTAESDAATLLNELGVPDDQHNLMMNDIPANIKVRILLAQALFGNPDILLLDEPTNNLDVTTISWLENFLADYQNIVLVVSHDRHFLDAVCTHVADVDKQKIKIYTGNYTFWYESSQLAARQATDKNKKQDEKKKDLLEFIARFSANASKSKQFEGKTLFHNVNFDVVKGQKIAFLSRNPVALTSFFEIIMNRMKPDHGHIEWGTTITSAYLPNDNSEYFTGELILLDWLRQFVPDHYTDVDEDFLRGFLGKMLFSGDEIKKKTTVLSGGEKVRCMISKMMLQNPNVVVLDEPTNHLDLESITAFNDGMINFPGIVLMTTHDHQFMQTTANRIIEITPKGIIDRLCDYDEYLADERITALQEEMYS